ncbi:unnamed protein product, partial [Laminaria digitata]
AVPPQPASPRTKYEEEEEEEEEEKEAVIAAVDALEPMPASQLRGAPAPVPAVTATTTPAAAAWTGKREDAPAASALGDDKDASLTLMVGEANDGPAHHHFGADNEAGAATALKPTRVESSASSSPASSPRLLVGALDPVERKGPSVLGARTNRGRLEAGRILGIPQLARVNSEGVLETTTGDFGGKKGLVAGKPSRERSGFMAPEAVKKGLGPAGAFAGNSNWRADASRDKHSSAADIKGDGHGGFHNPMAALRAQQQKERAKLQSGRVRGASEDWYAGGSNGGASKSLSPLNVPPDRVAMVTKGAGAAAAAALAPSAGLTPFSAGQSASASASTLAMPAWMMNKGMAGGGGRALRSPSGMLRSRTAQARLGQSPPKLVASTRRYHPLLSSSTSPDGSA